MIKLVNNIKKKVLENKDYIINIFILLLFIYLFSFCKKIDNFSNTEYFKTFSNPPYDYNEKNCKKNKYSIKIIDNFITPEECKLIIELAKPNLVRSTDTTKCIQIYTSNKIKNIHININI